VNELEHAADAALVETLTPTLKSAIDRLAARGLSRRAIEEFVVTAAKRAGGSNQSIVVLAVQAYLDSKR